MEDNESTLNLLLKSLDKSILFITDSKQIKEYISDNLHPKSHIPELEVYDKNIIPEHGFVVKYLTKRKESSICIDRDKKEVYIGGPINEKIEKTELTFLLVLLFEHLYQNDDIYGMHTAGIVGGDEKSVVIATDSLGGKTLLSTYMCRNYSCKMVGDERIVVGEKDGNVHILGGNVVISPRVSTLPLIFTPCKDIVSDGSSVLKFYPKDLGIDRSDGRREVKAVCRIHISDVYKVFKDIDDFNKQLMVYTNTSTDIKATGYSFINLNYPLPSLDSEEFERKRLQFSSLFRSIPGYDIFGSLDFISEKMKKIVKG